MTSPRETRRRRAGRGVPALVEELRTRIARHGPLRFDSFMEAALYDPQHGYYAAGRVRLGGADADFRTSPEVDPIFGELVGRQLVEMHRRLGEPRPFRVVELGPGSGRLAASVLTATGRHADGWEIHLVERSPALVERQRATLAALPRELRERARWSAADDLAAAPCDGVVLSNEFFDALPVRRVRMEGGRLRELRVDHVGDGGFAFVADAAPANLEGYFRDYGRALEDGQEAEACLDALAWVDGVARFLRRGYVVTVDYGDLADRLYDPVRRRGTVLSYREHRVVDDPLADVGLQDITSHVNFTALVRRGEERGLRAAALRTQTEFLLALGILERMEERRAGAPGAVAGWRDHLAAKDLFVPGGMGETFRVLVQALDAPLEGLAGLASPWRVSNSARRDGS